MFNIYVVFKCFPGKREDFTKALNEKGYTEAIRNEEGCIRYDFYFSEKDPNELLLIEGWESKAHQEAHIKTPHMAEVLKMNADYVESAELTEFNIVE